MTKFAALFALCAGSTAALAQVGYTTGTYNQNFDSLAGSGTTVMWTNNTTLPGWFNFSGTSGSNTIRENTTTNNTVGYRVDAGSNNAGSMYSYGSAGTTERALGSVGSSSFECVTLLVIQNNNAFDLTNFTLSFDGEQWRNGGNIAAQSLVFDYTILNALPTGADANASNVAGYTAVTTLNFTSPIATASAGPLDGNAAANRVANINSTVTVTVPAGSFLVLRWWDNNDPSNDHGLSLDNVSFSAAPTPGAAALLGMGLVAAGRRRRA